MRARREQKKQTKNATNFPLSLAILRRRGKRWTRYNLLKTRNYQPLLTRQLRSPHLCCCFLIYWLTSASAYRFIAKYIYNIVNSNTLFLISGCEFFVLLFLSLFAGALFLFLWIHLQFHWLKRSDNFLPLARLPSRLRLYLLARNLIAGDAGCPFRSQTAYLYT